MSPKPRGCSAVGSASPCQGEGREFESRHPLECELGGNIPGCTGIDPNTVTWPRGEAAACKAVYTGSNPVVTSADSYGVQRFSLEIRAIGAAVARFPDTEEVTGSIPVSRTEVLWPPDWVAVFVSDCVSLLCFVGLNGACCSVFGPSLHTCAVVYCAKWAPTVLVALCLGRLCILARLFTVRSRPQRGGGVAPSAVRAHPCRFRRSLTSRRCGVQSGPQRLLSTSVWAFFAYLRGCLLCKVGPNGCSPPAFGPSLHTCAVVYCAK